MKSLKILLGLVLSTLLYSCSPNEQTYVPIDEDVRYELNIKRCLNLEARILDNPESKGYYLNEINTINNFKY